MARISWLVVDGGSSSCLAVAEGLRSRRPASFDFGELALWCQELFVLELRKSVAIAKIRLKNLIAKVELLQERKESLDEVGILSQLQEIIDCLESRRDPTLQERERLVPEEAEIIPLENREGPSRSE